MPRCPPLHRSSEPKPDSGPIPRPIQPRPAGRARRLDRADGRADRHLLSFRDANLEHPRVGRRNVTADLVGLELEQGLAGLDFRAVGLQPAGQDPLGDRLSHGGDGDRDGGHGQLTPGRATTAAGVRSDDAETRCGTAAPTAARAISACSRSWTSLEPVAVLALASRPTYCTGKPSRS